MRRSVAVILLFVAGQVFASDGLAPPSNTALAVSEMFTLAAKAGDLVQERHNLVKEDKVYKDNSAQLQAEYNQKLQVAAQQRQVYEDNKTSITNAYNAACIARGALPPAEKSACDARRSQDQARLNQIQSEELTFVNDFNRKVKGHYDDIFARQNKRRNELAKKFNATRDQVNAIHARYNVLLKYVQTHIKDVSADCKKILADPQHSNARIETIKWCSDIPFDGTNVKVPLMPEDGYGTGNIQF